MTASHAAQGERGARGRRGATGPPNVRPEAHPVRGQAGAIELATHRDHAAGEGLTSWGAAEHRIGRCLGLPDPRRGSEATVSRPRSLATPSGYITAPR